MLLIYNYYKLLGINTNAGISEIKQAYRKMAFAYHPDRNTDEKAKEFFQVLTEAYGTLSDPAKRKKYDQKNHFNIDSEEIYATNVNRRRNDRKSVNNTSPKFQFKEEMPPKFARTVLFVTGLIFGLFMIVFPIIHSVDYFFSPTIIFVFLGLILTVDSLAGITGYRTMIFYELFRVIRNR